MSLIEDTVMSNQYFIITECCTIHRKQETILPYRITTKDKFSTWRWPLWSKSVNCVTLHLLRSHFWFKCQQIQCIYDMTIT